MKLNGLIGLYDLNDNHNKDKKTGKKRNSKSKYTFIIAFS